MSSVGVAHGYSICPLRGQESLFLFLAANPAFVPRLLNDLLRNLSRHGIVMRELHVETSARGRDRVERRLIVEHLDRKSTRLNSSHGYISYAVFCLKKKKKHHT